MALGNGNGATSAVNGDIKNTTVNEKTLINNTGTTAEVEQAYKTSRQTDPSTSFLRAARSGQLETIQEFLDLGTIKDINVSNANGLNALHLAAKEGHTDVVLELIRRGAVVDAATKKGNTALHIACLAGQEEIVRILVQNGAAINVQSQNGFSPLYMAAQENHDGCVKYLLSKGANQTLATEDGFTPLAVAMQQGHEKVVAVLLEHDTRGKVRLPALHIAAKKDDIKAAALLLQNNQNPDVTSKSGFTPLHIAAHYGNDNVAKLLHEKGADVNFAAKHNITPLHVASKWGKVSMVMLLIEKGANIEAQTRDGLTPLHCAARSGHEQVCDILADKGASLNSKTKNGLAPLHMAAQGDHAEAARSLLRRGAPVDDVTVDYLTPLHVASHCGHVRVARLLLDKKAHADARALNGFTPLHIACKKNRIKIVELLLKYGASISATTESGLTPLHVASFMGCMNIVIYLLQHDASPDVHTVRGETPLHLAARANQTDIIRILLRNGASVDAKAREQQTPLHVACRLGNADIVLLLLQHGAQHDAVTSDMYTPLHIAAKEGKEEVSQLLLENGASITATTKKGFTPLHIAAKYGQLNIAKRIIDSCTARNNNNKNDEISEKSLIENQLKSKEIIDAAARNGVTPLHVAAHYNSQPIAQLLLENGASPQAVARNGHTPLHIAAKKNQMDIAALLLEHKTAANAESKAGFTPLHLSAQEGHTEMTQLLIENSANIDHAAKNGLTPLHLAAQYDRYQVAKILLDHGANSNSTTKTGYTPLHVASHYGNANIVKLLLENGANVGSATELGYTPLHQAAQQGHTLIINILLKSKADPNAQTKNGQTALSIANKLGYVTVVETLKVVTTETIITTTISSTFEEKYRVVAPEAMHDTFLSDSEDEGEDPMLSDTQQYRYMTVDNMKSLGDDSMPIDVTNDERHENKLFSGGPMNGDIVIHSIRESVLTSGVPPTQVDNVNITRPPIHAGFLVSFLVDARGGAMRGCRHSGVRVIVPPRAASSPIRITCRYVRIHRPNVLSSNTITNSAPPTLPLGEGEALASRILELGPVGVKFLGPVILEVPHFASLRGDEREIVVWRSDTGESWREHSLDASNEAVQDVLQDSFQGEELLQIEDLHTSRIVRILTNELPRYLAVVQRCRQDGGIIGPEGGILSCRAVPQAQAVFPPNALTKRIRVALQAQPMDPTLVHKVLGRSGIAVSPILTIEPRRRKFHRAITLGLPAPKAQSMGMINQYQSSGAPTLRLLCSITGGQSRAVWEDVTGSTPLSFVKDCVTFTTTVSARFWLMDCRNASETTQLATELYNEVCRPPFMAKFVVFAKRTGLLEASLRVFCMTDDKEDKTLESQEHFIEVAKSKDVEVLEGKAIYIECAGNLIPIIKSGEQLCMNFNGFQENRLAFEMRIRNPDEDPVGRIIFMNNPKVPKGEQPQPPLCTLNVTLPNTYEDGSDYGSQKGEIGNFVNSKKKFFNFLFLKNFNSLNYLLGDMIHRGYINLESMSRLLQADWPKLATEIDHPISPVDIELIKSEYSDSVQQALIMLKLWLKQVGPLGTGNVLASALHKIGRSDIVEQCIDKVELVTDNKEIVAAQNVLEKTNLDESLTTDKDQSISEHTNTHDSKIWDHTLDKSGFDALKDDIGSSGSLAIKDDEKNILDVDTVSSKISNTDKDHSEKDDAQLDISNSSNTVLDVTNNNEKPLKSILKNSDNVKDTTKIIIKDNITHKEALDFLAEQFNNLDTSNSMNLQTPPPSPAADNKESENNLENQSYDITWDMGETTLGDLSSNLIDAEKISSKTSSTSHPASPHKIKTIKKHTKLSKEFQKTAGARPTVEEIFSNAKEIDPNLEEALKRDANNVKVIVNKKTVDKKESKKQNSKIPVSINTIKTTTEKEVVVEYNSDTDSQQSPLRYQDQNEQQMLGSSSESDVALHEGQSDDDDQVDQQTFAESYEEIHISGDKKSRSNQGSSDLITSPGSSDGLKGGSIESFLAEERKY
ncbi:ankyrin-3-like isoform X2 [Chrysoperla carnea]|uniref:ankyrin-3-like isoform X2 n=1 Tax=Chrysoperla carnea TaxID=189513 RepID=UPI001D064FBD|nr:ankyrin-3-like isoform X2 [Chrysoperla carnea]